MRYETSALFKLELNSQPNVSGCIEWIGSKDRKGYGRVYLSGKNRLAHRISYMQCVGAIPAGKVLDHLCRNTLCINPAHLEPVTHKENILRGVAPRVLIHKTGKCAVGHEMTGRNLYQSPGGRRHCRECNRLAVHRYKNRRTA